MDNNSSEITAGLLADMRKSLEKSRAKVGKHRARAAEIKAWMKAIKGK